ncbi:uncharacterized protein [Nicotiana tomentosiformis]|uniref:uncharacterized protein n=1 Tax=Nicotiana tomentosiformis TaxID=4098 RepID=UPI00388CECB1
MPYAEACEILDEMVETLSAWQCRANVPQGDPNMIHLHKELQDHGQAIAELTTTMTQLAKAQLNQVQSPKKVNVMEGVNMMVNKRRTKGPQVQNRMKNYAQKDSGFDHDDSSNEQEEEDKTPLPKPPPPYPQRLTKQNSENQFKKFIQMMKSLSINVPLVEALEKMPIYAMFLKDLVTKKRSMNFEMIKLSHQVSAIVHSMAPKLENPGAFPIPCIIGSAEFAKALCDLGETDFVILDCEVDYEVTIILGRPFLAAGKNLCDVEARELTFRVGDE